jgi:hypothetical protein
MRPWNLAAGSLSFAARAGGHLLMMVRIIGMYNRSQSDSAARSKHSTNGALKVVLGASVSRLKDSPKANSEMKSTVRHL